mmetsp:Transcript_22817/g.52414  ORF Transcript_22817/g.52414 Transcript_22817/m.52414 type:complete len:83 (-) Transcript_22817:1195-1443(-)
MLNYKMNQNYFKLGFVNTKTNLFFNKNSNNKTKQNSKKWVANINEPFFNFKTQNRRKIFQILTAGSTLLTPFFFSAIERKKR